MDVKANMDAAQPKLVYVKRFRTLLPEPICRGHQGARSSSRCGAAANEDNFIAAVKAAPETKEASDG